MAAALAVAGKKLWSRGDLLPQDHTIIELVVEALQRISVLMKPCAADGIDLVLAHSLPDVQQVCGLMVKVAVRSDDRKIPWAVLPDVEERQRDPEPDNEKEKDDHEKVNNDGGKLNEDASTCSRAKPEDNNTRLNPYAFPFVPPRAMAQFWNPHVPEVNSENSHMGCKPGLHPGAIPFVPGTTWVSLSALDGFVCLEATRLGYSDLQEVHEVAEPEDVPEDAKVDTGYEKPASPVPSEDGSSSSGKSSRVRSDYGDEGGSIFVDGARIVD